MSEEQVFAAALEKHNLAEQSAFLDAVCAADPAMRQRIETMLRAHEKVGNFLERPAVEQIAAGGAPLPSDSFTVEVVLQMKTRAPSQRIHTAHPQPKPSRAARKTMTRRWPFCNLRKKPVRWAGWDITKCRRFSATAASARC